MSKHYSVKVKAGATGQRYNAKTGQIEQFPIERAISAGVEFGPDPVELAEGPVIGLLRSNELLEIKPVPSRK